MAFKKSDRPKKRKKQSATLSLTRRMQNFSKEERQKAMSAAAEMLAEYYRTDPEILEWQALAVEDFYDINVSASPGSNA